MEAADSRKAVSWGGAAAAVIGLGLMGGSIVFGVNARWDDIAKAFLAGSTVMFVAGTALAIAPRAYTHYKSRYGEDEMKLMGDTVSYKGKDVTIQLQHTGRTFETSRYHISGLGWRKNYMGSAIPKALQDTAKSQLPYGTFTE